jgi:HEAT repeat protein
MRTPYSLRAVALLAVFVVSAGIAQAADDAAQKEQEQIAILKSDAAPGDKAIACKQLAIYGTSAAVPELAKLLPNEQLASWARIALEAIPGGAADEALRSAAKSLDGLLLVGTLNSIGVRRDAAAVPVLADRLKAKDEEVASAAAVALGRIGNEAAAESLRSALASTSGKVRSAVAEGCVLAAEQSLAAGKTDAAIALYDEVRKADVPRQRILEAIRGAILARGEEGIPLLVEQFQSPDKAIFNIALATAREFPGRAVDKALAAEVARATPERAALLIYAMADRRETVVLSAVLAAANEGPQPVRKAAIAALGRVGDASCLSPLFEIALEDNAELNEAAKEALAALSGDQIDTEIIARLPAAEGKLLPLLLELVGRRQVAAALPELLKALDNDDADVRGAALAAMGQTVTPEKLSVLIAQVVKPKHADDAPAAQKALITACIRMPDREACAAELTTALNDSPTPTKATLLNILGSVGGTKALETVAAAARSDEPDLQDASTRVLGEWMTADAAPVLLDLVKTAPADKYQSRAFRGYLRIVRQFAPEDQRLPMCQSAFAAARNPAEKKLVLEAIRRWPNVEMLKLAVAAAAEPEMKDDATQSALAIAQGMGGQADIGLREGQAGDRQGGIRRRRQAAGRDGRAAEAGRRPAGDHAAGGRLQRQLRRGPGARHRQEAEGPVQNQRQGRRGHVRRGRSDRAADAEVTASRQRHRPGFHGPRLRRTTQTTKEAARTDLCLVGDGRRRARAGLSPARLADEESRH